MRKLIPLFFSLTLIFSSLPVFAAEIPEGVDDTPEGYVLSAAYPNPFNPSTSFSLEVDERQQVSVEVFNMLGQRVRTLFEGEMLEGETKTFTFEAENLPSGIYLYRATGQKFVATRQITLLK